MQNLLKRELECFGYDPFGMITFGRNWEAGSEYRYGFNGKESDNEISDNKNKLDFGARLYNADLGVWFSLDVKMYKYPHLSPYSANAGNPILIVDRIGMDLSISSINFDQAKNDILDLVTEENRCNISFVKVSEGLYKVEFSEGISLEGCNTSLNNDAGTILLQNLVSADENYLYTVNNTLDYLHKFVTGDEVRTHAIAVPHGGIGGQTLTPYGTLVLSTTARDITKTTKESQLKNGSLMIPLPIDGISFQGQVTIAESGNWTHPDGSVYSRGELAFHELWECWERTTNLKPYAYPKGDNRKGAHQLSIDAQNAEGEYKEGIYSENEGYWNTKDSPKSNAGNGSYTYEF